MTPPCFLGAENCWMTGRCGSGDGLSKLRKLQVGLRKWFSFSSAISACEKCGRWEQALELLGAQLQWDILPDGVSYNSAISACEKAAKWELALFVSEEMPKAQLLPDVVTYNSAIAACESCGVWAKALELLDLMDQVGHFWGVWNSVLDFVMEVGFGGAGPDQLQSLVKSWVAEDREGSAITACEKGFQWTWALQLLQRMRCRDLAPDVICCNSLASACARASAWRLALALAPKVADEVTLSALCCASEKGRAWQSALQLLRGARERMLEAEVMSHNSCLIGLRSRWRHLLWFLDDMAWRLRRNVASFAAATEAVPLNAPQTGWLHQKLHALGLQGLNAISGWAWRWEDRSWSSFLQAEEAHEGGRVVDGLRAIRKHEERFLRKIHRLRWLVLVISVLKGEASELTAKGSMTSGRLSLTDKEDKDKGVPAFGSGNHGESERIKQLIQELDDMKNKKVKLVENYEETHVAELRKVRDELSEMEVKKDKYKSYYTQLDEHMTEEEAVCKAESEAYEKIRNEYNEQVKEL
eukprot:s4561_g1.t1